MPQGSASLQKLIRPISKGNADGGLVLFLPGLSGNQGQWDLVLPLLSSAGARLAYGPPILPSDAFGAGRPTVTELANRVANELRDSNERRVVLVAHSVGSFVALAVARQAPDRVASVLLVNGGLTSVAKFLDKPLRQLVVAPRTSLEAMRLFLLVGTPAPQALKTAIASSERSTRLLMGKLIANNTLLNEDQRRALIEQAGSPDILRALWDNRHHWPELLQYCAEIETPITFLVGDQDPMSGVSDSESMAALFPNASVKVLAGVGHAAPVESATTVAEIIRASL